MSSLNVSEIPFISQPSDFYQSAYTTAQLLACERDPGTEDCVVVRLRRPWHLRSEWVWIDPSVLPDYYDRYL